MQDDTHLLISYLTALANFAKDFHYYCKSFGKHLFADVVEDNLYEYLDEIKENILLGSERLPLSSKVYLQIAAVMTPQITNDDVQNLVLMKMFLNAGKQMVNDMVGTSRGENALLDEIAGHLDKAIGLTFLQLRKFTPIEIKVQESVTVEHCKACVEKDIDRAKAMLAKINYDKVADTVLDYSNQHAAMCEDTEEDVLNKLSKKLGV